MLVILTLGACAGITNRSMPPGMDQLTSTITTTMIGEPDRIVAEFRVGNEKAFVGKRMRRPAGQRGRTVTRLRGCATLRATTTNTKGPGGRRRAGRRRSADVCHHQTCVACASLAILLAGLPWAAAPVQAADPIKVGFSMALTGGVAPNGKQNPAGAGNLARRRQRQGRTAGASGRARLLRRPEQPEQRAGDLHQAHQRRQSRPADRPLCHQHDRPRRCRRSCRRTR